MVNRLLTVSIKVNILASAESQLVTGDVDDEKEPPGSLELLEVDAWRWYRKRRRHGGLSHSPVFGRNSNNGGKHLRERVFLHV